MHDQVGILMGSAQTVTTRPIGAMPTSIIAGKQIANLATIRRAAILVGNVLTATIRQIGAMRISTIVDKRIVNPATIHRMMRITLHPYRSVLTAITHLIGMTNGEEGSTCVVYFLSLLLC